MSEDKKDQNGPEGEFNRSADFLSFIRAQKKKEEPTEAKPEEGKGKEFDQDSIASLVTDNSAVKTVQELNENIKGVRRFSFGVSNLFKNVSNGYDAHVRPYVTPIWNWLGKPAMNSAVWLGKATAGNYLKIMRAMAFPKDEETQTRTMSKKGTMGAIMTTTAVAMALWMGAMPALHFAGKNVIWDGVKLPSERIEYVYTNGVDPVHDGASQAVFYEVPTSEVHPGNDSEMARIDQNMYYGIWPQEAEELAARVPDETGFAVTKEVGWRLRAPWGVINLYPEIVELSASAVSLLPDGHPGEHGQQVTDQIMAEWIQELPQSEYELYRDTNVIPDFLIDHLEGEGLISVEFLQSMGEQVSFSIPADSINVDGTIELAGTFNGDVFSANSYSFAEGGPEVTFSYNGVPVTPNKFIPS